MDPCFRSITPLAILLVLIVATDLFANEGNEGDAKTWNTYHSAMQMSRQTGRPVMLVFSGSDWCSWCRRLESEVLRTQQFSTWAEANVLAVYVDFPQGHMLPTALAQQNEQLKQRFSAHVQYYPTVLFVNANQQVIGKMGFVEGGPDDWIQQAQAFASKTRIKQKYEK